MTTTITIAEKKKRVKKIVKELENRYMKQSFLAEKTGKSKAYISNVLNGREVPSEKLLKKMENSIFNN